MNAWNNSDTHLGIPRLLLGPQSYVRVCMPVRQNMSQNQKFKDKHRLPRPGFHKRSSTLLSMKSALEIGLTLSLVALTARVFLHQAQSHLFRSIKLEVSYCTQQNSEDWDAFYAILLQSPDIKFYIREIFVNSLVFSDGSYHAAHGWPWRCPHHAGSQKQHFVSRKFSIYRVSSLYFRV